MLELNASWHSAAAAHQLDLNTYSNQKPDIIMSSHTHSRHWDRRRRWSAAVQSSHGNSSVLIVGSEAKQTGRASGGRGHSCVQDDDGDDDASVLTFDTFATEATDTPPNGRTSSRISSRSVGLPEGTGAAVAASGAQTTANNENAANAPAAAPVTPEKDAAAKSGEEVHAVQAESSPCTFITCSSSTDAAASVSLLSPDGNDDEEKAPRLVGSDAEAASAEAGFIQDEQEEAATAAATEGAEEATSDVTPERQRAERIAAADAESLRLEQQTMRPSPVSPSSANGISRELLSIASSDGDVGSGNGMHVFEEDTNFDDFGGDPDADGREEEEEKDGGALDEDTNGDDFGELLDSDKYEEEEQGGALDGFAEVSAISTSTTTTPTSIAWLAAAASASASASASRYGPEAAPKPRRDVSDAISNLSERMNQAWSSATSSPPPPRHPKESKTEEEAAGGFDNEESSEQMVDSLPRPDHLQGHCYRRDDSDAVSAAPSVASSATPVTGTGTRAVSFLFDTTGSADAPSVLSCGSNAEEEDGTAAFGERFGGVELSGFAQLEPEMARDLAISGNIIPSTLVSGAEYDATKATSSIDIEVGSMGEVEVFAPDISGRSAPKNRTMDCRPSGPSDGSSRVSRTLAKVMPSGGCSVKPVHALFLLVPIVCVLLYLCYAYLVGPNL